jgi:hypothetical protein
MAKANARIRISLSILRPSIPGPWPARGSVATPGLGALLPELHQRRQAGGPARRIAQARGAIAPVHEAGFAPLAQALGLEAWPEARPA